jgi:hypothetical protein
MRQRKFQLKLDEDEAVFLLGLEPRRIYQIEIDDEEMFETQSDPAGILEVDVPRGRAIGMRIREAPL